MREKTSRFPLSTFWIVLAVLLITAGIGEGVQVGMAAAQWQAIIQVHIMVVYWLSSAALLTFLIRERMKKVYDTPLQEISAATKQVAKGDFSVRIQPLNKGKNEDYLDVMIADLNTMVDELGSIETLKTDFISNVSHEMKTPLAVIKNYAELLQAPGLPEDERAEYAQSIEEAAGKMTELITNILRLNRIENQKIVPELMRYDVCRQLADCLLQFESRWEEKQIEPDFDLEDSAYINADESLLELAWNNLISNAIKFTEPGGSITVRERTEGGKVVVSFTDTGCGMSEEAQKRIFDKFYQGDTSHATEGNGLGLALVQRVMALLGGEITVESELGKGSTFTVTLPGA